MFFIRPSFSLCCLLETLTRPRCGAGEGERAGSAPRGFPTAIWLVSWAPELRVPGWRLAGRQTSAHSWQRVAPRRPAHILEGGRGRENERKREKEREESSERARARGGERSRRACAARCARGRHSHAGPQWPLRLVAIREHDRTHSVHVSGMTRMLALRARCAIFPNQAWRLRRRRRIRLKSPCR
jgi:hypothetical protein